MIPSQMRRLHPIPAIRTQVLHFVLVPAMDQIASQPKNIALDHYSFIQSINPTHSLMAAWKSDQHAINVLTHSAPKKKKEKKTTLNKTATRD